MNLSSEKNATNIFKRLLSDEETITFDNTEMTMGHYREMEEKFSPKEKSKKSVILFWDDMMQFTTIGLVECLLEYVHEDAGIVWDYTKFFYRGYDNTDYITFVKSFFLTEYEVTLTDQFIKDFQKDNYAEILKKSPASSFFMPFFRCEPIYKNVLLCFRTHFEGIESFAKSFYDNYFTGRFNIPISVATLDNYKNEYEFLVKNCAEVDIFILQNLGHAFDYIEDSHRYNLNLIGPSVHNGIEAGYFEVAYQLYKSDRVGPNNSELTIFNEGLSVI